MRQSIYRRIVGLNDGNLAVVFQADGARHTVMIPFCARFACAIIWEELVARQNPACVPSGVRCIRNTMGGPPVSTYGCPTR
ncbi:hypothetical protein NBRC116589_21570 [Ruegeria sp. HU-ET01832]